MKPSLPEFALQAGSTPTSESTRVEPVRNPYADVATKLGEATFSFGEQIQHREDVATALEADNKLADGVRALLHSPNGYLNQIGRSAKDNRMRTLESLDRLHADILGTLSPDQRAYVARSANARRVAAQAAVDGHYAEQTRIYEVGQSEARATSLLQEAQDAYFTPGLPATVGREPKTPISGQELAAVAEPEATYFETTRDGAFRELHRLAQMRGMSPEQANLVVSKARDNLYGSIIDRLNDSGSALGAADFLAKHGGNMTSEARMAAAKAVREAGVKEQGQRLATWLSSEQGSLVGRLTKLHSLGLPVELSDEAERRFLHFESVKLDSQTASDNKGLQAAKEWAQLHPSEKLPQELRDGLGSNAMAFELWSLQGNRDIDTRNGLLVSAAETVSSLQRFKSPDELVSFYSKLGVSTKTLGALLAERAKGAEAAFKETTKEPTTEDLRRAAEAALLRRGIYSSPLGGKKLSGGAENPLTERVSAMVDALSRALPQGTMPTQQKVDAAVQSVFEKDAVMLGGTLYPRAWLTNTEHASAEALRSSKGESASVDTLFGQGIGDTRNRVKTSARTPGGALVKLLPDVEEQVMNRDEATRAFALVNGRAPTETELADFQLAAQEKRRAAQADAARIASIEGKAEAASVASMFDVEVQREFIKSRERLKYEYHRGWGSTPKTSDVPPDAAYVDAINTVYERHRAVLQGAGVSLENARSWLSGITSDLNVAFDPEEFRGRRASLTEAQPLDVNRFAGLFAGFGVPRPATPAYNPAPTSKELDEVKALRAKYEPTTKQ